MNTNTETTIISVEQAQKEITELRWWINRCDARIRRDLVKRNSYVEQIGEYKRRAGMPVKDKSREISLLTDCITFAWNAGVPHEIITGPYITIMQVSKMIQQRGKPQKLSPRLFEKVFG